MIAIGEYSELTILRETSVGLFLGDDEGEDVLLPNKYCPEKFDIGDKIRVFVYLDYDERKVATNLTPKINLHEFALLEVTAVANVGAFLDWGMEKNLMVPFKEQRQKMEVGRWYIVYLDIDEQTNRLYASNRIEKRLQNNTLTVAEGDEVEVLVFQKTDIGFSVIVNNAHKGLLFKNEVFTELRVGDKVTGYVKKIREENKIDIALQPSGYINFIESTSEEVYRVLVANRGFLAVTDKSAPAMIYEKFGISKKAFKKAVGDLYKQRKITIEEGGIRVV
ncbi:MAG: GntR family transcriptional regulator [Bacteroidetes bacterium]|nr:MAG: GntR family transcriptional regulator [Bacteroidota bacterium]